jgi:TRAP-type C4-dicarboxylate transport system permease small subunit
VRGFLVGFGNRISGLGLLVAAAGLILIVAINGANVVARYVFFAPFSWAEEAMLYIMIASIFWGAIAVAWRQVDICIDAFVNLTTGRLHRILRNVVSLISIAIVFSLFFVSSRVALSMFNFDQRSDALHLPIWIPHSAFASGLLLVILMLAVRLLAPIPRPDANSPDQSS